MKSFSVLRTLGAFVAIVLGVLFFIYLPHDPGDLATDVIFVGLGVLLLKGPRQSSRVGATLPQKSGNKPSPQGKKQKKR